MSNSTDQPGSNITHRPVKIEITYSNSETLKLGVNIGDVFNASQEVYKGEPKMACWFKGNCVAYACEHDPDADILVTTCKIITD